MQQEAATLPGSVSSWLPPDSVFPCRLSTRDDGLEKDVLRFFDKWHQVDIPSHHDDKHGLVGIPPPIGMLHDIEEKGSLV
jgi:hypothetical protein